MAPDIDAPADELEGGELPEATGGAVAAIQALSYLVTAYRWGCTNEHAYHVYCGADRTKALALARSEQADRGGKYAAVVWEFDADGTEQKPIAYFHSSMDPDNAVVPHHNHRIDYFERIGQFVDECMSGKALLPDPANAKHLTYQEITPLPDYLQAQVQRQREFLKVWQGFDEKHAGAKGSSN